MWQPPGNHHRLGSTSPCNKAGESKTRFQTQSWGSHSIRAEPSSRKMADLEHSQRRERPRRERERRRAKDTRMEKQGQEGDKREAWVGTGGMEPKQMLQHPSGIVPGQEWASARLRPDSRRVCAFKMYLCLLCFKNDLNSLKETYMRSNKIQNVCREECDGGRTGEQRRRKIKGELWFSSWMKM